MAALESPIPRGFEARAAGKEPPPECDRLAADSDLYKWLEGACYVYARTQDAELRAEIDRIVGLILKCRKPEGYINTQIPPNKPFDQRIRHELYIAGHFFEAAVVHHRATGCEDLLETACGWADYLIAEHEKGNPYFDKPREHPEYELGFLRLGRETGRGEYVDFAATLAKEMSRVGPKVADVRAGGGLHAVRTGYLLAGMADLYLETARRDMIEHLPGLWRELVDTRMYLTGAIGSHGETISKKPFDLPPLRVDHNHRHLGETCACGSMIMFTWRMHGITGRSECFDVIERALYNHYLGALSLDNMANFYYNPLHVTGDLSGKTDHGHKPMCTRCRLPEIHSTACCMPNAWRFLGALPKYVFSYDEDGLFVNLYTAATVDHVLPDGRRARLAVETDYPHDGKGVPLVKADTPQVLAFEKPERPGNRRMATLASVYTIDCYARTPEQVVAALFRDDRRPRSKDRPQPRLRYDEYLQAGYPIATGVIEGACRHLVKDRMERAGMRWRLAGAQPMLHVRAVYQSSYWNQFHANRIVREQSQLHPNRSLLEAYRPAALAG